MDLFKCPLDETLPDMPKQACSFRIGQVVKLVFGIIGSTPPFSETGETPTPITAKASWDPLVSATDATKIVVTNYLNNLVVPSTDLIEDGGDTNINRVPEMVDGGNAQATFNPKDIEPAIRVAMKKLTQFSAIQPGVSELGVMFINADGDVIHDGTKYWIPVYNLFIGDSDIVAEKGKGNSSIGKFLLLYGWSDNLKKSTPAFNILASYPAAITP